MSNTEIKIGNAMLDYMDTLAQIQESLVDSVTTISTIQTNIEAAYEGEAKEEMEAFINSLSAHINRLSLFYQKGQQYTQMTYQSFYYNDEEMVKWMIGKMDGGA